MMAAAAAAARARAERAAAKAAAEAAGGGATNSDAPSAASGGSRNLGAVFASPSAAKAANAAAATKASPATATTATPNIVSLSSASVSVSATAASTSATESVAAAAKAPVPSAARRHSKRQSVAPEHYWSELRTTDGTPYYFNKQTQVTQWDKPNELKTAEDYARDGDWYWVPDDKEAFVPGKKIQTLFDGSVNLEMKDGKVCISPARQREICVEQMMSQTQRIFSHFVFMFVFSQTQTVPKNIVLEPLSWRQLLQPPSDLVMLDEMNMPLILYTLRHRFDKGSIYTNVGDILISINPFRPLPLYTPMVIDQYQHRGSSELPPHVFIIADEALRGLLNSDNNQSIIISGESGAGKTEATKQCLQFLAETAGSSTRVEQKILMANPILEAFGNAKTVRNNNSSRFGKYIEVFFSSRGQIDAARNTQYLLEKTRVVLQSHGERNYHVFYQLVRGSAAAANVRALHLTTEPENYAYLTHSGCTEIDGVDDAHDFKDLLSAMQLLQFSQSGASTL